MGQVCVGDRCVGQGCHLPVGGGKNEGKISVIRRRKNKNIHAWKKRAKKSLIQWRKIYMWEKGGKKSLILKRRKIMYVEKERKKWYS